MPKNLLYQIEITLQTDGDFCFKKELLPPDFFTNDCREIIKLAENEFKCNIYNTDMTSYGWNENEWGNFIARSTFEKYISAIHVGHTHLYIWEYLLRSLEELTSFIYSKANDGYSNEFISEIHGNYEGTEFIIRKVTE